MISVGFRFKNLPITQKSIVINAIIMFFWWITFNPGFFSGDSFRILDIVKSGQLSSELTIFWAVLVKIITINGNHPEFATLVFSQIFGVSISIFSNTLFKGKIALWSSAVLCLTPLVGAMGITLWHDIPMTSGFLLTVVGFHRIVKQERHAFTLLLIGLTLSAFRYNGIPTLLLTCLIFFILNRKKSVAVVFVIICIFSLMSSTLNSYFDPKISTFSDGMVNWMRYDISCYAASTSDKTFYTKEFSGRTTREYWASSQACTWFNDSQAFRDRSEFDTSKIPRAWLALTLENPIFVLTTHLKRHAYLNPIPLYGKPKIPFIHTTIEYSGRGIQFLNPKLSESLRTYPRIWNYFNFVFGYSGFWLLLICLFAWKRKSSIYFGIGILGLVLNSGLFVFAIISDARFSLFVLVAAQLIAIGEILKYTSERKLLISNKSLTRNIR
jgi:hypothetical protein